MEYNLTLAQAQEALKQGHKVSHHCFRQKEYFVMEGMITVNENYYKVGWQKYETEKYSDGWGILEYKQNSIEAKVKFLVDLCGNIIFPEYYSHTNQEMWKIINPYTHYREDKFVLGSVEEGFEKSLDKAIEQITIAKEKYFAEIL